MESEFLQLLNKRVKLPGIRDCRVVDILFLVFVTLASVFLRFSLRETVSGDYTCFLSPWYDQIKELGWASLGYNIGNYSPLYMYLFTAATFLPLDSLTAVKGITLLFDYITAAVFFVLVYRFSDSFFKATVAWGAVLFLPSAVLNGAVWAQCDIIYSLFLILSFALVSKGRSAAKFLLKKVDYTESGGLFYHNNKEKSTLLEEGTILSIASPSGVNTPGIRFHVEKSCLPLWGGTIRHTLNIEKTI